MNAEIKLTISSLTKFESDTTAGLVRLVRMWLVCVKFLINTRSQSS